MTYSLVKISIRWDFVRVETRLNFRDFCNYSNHIYYLLISLFLMISTHIDTHQLPYRWKKAGEKWPNFVLGDQILTSFDLIPTNIFNRFLFTPINYLKFF